jgi:DNA topoisomerase-1
MSKNLVIVESPAKAKTIAGYLGDGFVVKSSYGHIRDLVKNDKAVDVERGFSPLYEVPADKKERVNELKKAAKAADLVWLASDEDREGEAISWHLQQVLELPDDKVRRIVFHEITKSAIQHAVQNPRKIDIDLVNAQQARRILDRLVGFELSPVLWKKVRPKLSAGRVQSVAVRLVAEREHEIMTFQSSPAFRVVANLRAADNGLFDAEWPQRLSTVEAAHELLSKLQGKRYEVVSVEQKPLTKSPAPPFTTSTLQQEASRKLRFAVNRTMRLAQDLYEAGKITYMRTDSVNLSDFALGAASDRIQALFGGQYVQQRRFKTKSASAQEAHEAIRPTDFAVEQCGMDAEHQRLYELIWKRALASQMADARLEKTVARLRPEGMQEAFVAEGEVIQFDGFLKLYLESTDEEEGNREDNDNKKSSDSGARKLPRLTQAEWLSAEGVTATERYSRPPARYTEASLVKKLEELGIGRPSTYAPTITTIQAREYVVKSQLEGFKRSYRILRLKSNAITQETREETTGADKGKLMPTDIGLLVTEFLIDNFANVMRYDFTAHVEAQFDQIASGSMEWDSMIQNFYGPFHDDVQVAIGVDVSPVNGERILGPDPVSGWMVSVRMGKYGPLAQMTDPQDVEAKPRFANIPDGLFLNNITLEQALPLFALPKALGTFEELSVSVGKGKFGPFVRHGQSYVSLPKDADLLAISLEQAIEFILAKRKKDAEKVIHHFETLGIQVLNGQWGPYLTCDGRIYKIPKSTDAKLLTSDECLVLIKEGEATSKPLKGGAKKPGTSAVRKKSIPRKKTS